MVHCAWIGCSNSSDGEKYRVSPRTFFTLPKDPGLREQWIRNTMRDFTGLKLKQVRLCEDHFDPEMFQIKTDPDFLSRIGFTERVGRMRRQLKPGALPHKFQLDKKNERHLAAVAAAIDKPTTSTCTKPRTGSPTAATRPGGSSGGASKPLSKGRRKSGRQRKLIPEAFHRYRLDVDSMKTTGTGLRMPREIKPPSRYMTEDGPLPQLPRRSNLAQPSPSSSSSPHSSLSSDAAKRSRGRSTSQNKTQSPGFTPSRPTRPSAGRHLSGTIVIGDDDDSDVEIVEPPPKSTAKRKRDDDKDPDWGSARKLSRTQDRANPRVSRPPRTPQPTAAQTLAQQRAGSRTAPAAPPPKAPQVRNQKNSPATPKASQPRNPPRMIMSVPAMSPTMKNVLGGMDLYMECQEEPLSVVQVQSAKQAQLQYEKSQMLIRAAQEGRLLFSPTGETKVLKKPYQPPKPPTPPPPPPPPPPPQTIRLSVPSPVSLLPSNPILSQLNHANPRPGYASVPNKPAGVVPSRPVDSPRGSAQSRTAAGSNMSLTDRTPVIGTHGLGVKLPPWEAVPPPPTLPPATPRPPPVGSSTSAGGSSAKKKGSASQKASANQKASPQQKASAQQQQKGKGGANTPSPRTLTTAVAKMQEDILTTLRPKSKTPKGAPKKTQNEKASGQKENLETRQGTRQREKKEKKEKEVEKKKTSKQEKVVETRQTMQEEAKARSMASEAQKKKDKKQTQQVEGDDSGNWVPLDEYYYGKMEGDPTFKESKGEFRFKCYYCFKMLYSNVTAMLHIQGHIDSEKQVNLDLSDLTSCKHCHKVFNTPFEMQTHIEKVHMNKANVLLCRICEKDHDTRAALKEHMRRNHNACEMPYTCQLCKFRSSMYSDVVDHFKKKHSNSSSLLCLYCLKTFNVQIISQGYGQTLHYYNHLLKHQVKNCTKKCHLCKLIFLSASALKVHKQTDHLPNQKGVIGIRSKYTSPDQVMIKVAGETAGGSASGGRNSKGGGAGGSSAIGGGAGAGGASGADSSGVRSLNVQAVKKVMDHRLILPTSVYRVKCVECSTLMGMPDHYKKFIQCSMCRFASSCSYAYSNHMLGFHSGQLTAVSALNIPADRPMACRLYCDCGFSSRYGNQIANHLVSCSKISCYKDPPPTPAGDSFGSELQDPRKKPDACLLDVLGLVKKDALASFGSRQTPKPESPPREHVDMPEVSDTAAPPARRPSLLRDSMKKSFKNILKDRLDSPNPDKSLESAGTPGGGEEREESVKIDEEKKEEGEEAVVGETDGTKGENKEEKADTQDGDDKKDDEEVEVGKKSAGSPAQGSKEEKADTQDGSGKGTDPGEEGDDKKDDGGVEVGKKSAGTAPGEAMDVEVKQEQLEAAEGGQAPAEGRVEGGTDGSTESTGRTEKEGSTESGDVAKPDNTENFNENSSGKKADKSVDPEAAEDNTTKAVASESAVVRGLLADYGFSSDEDTREAEGMSVGKPTAAEETEESRGAEEGSLREKSESGEKADTSSREADESMDISDVSHQDTSAEVACGGEGRTDKEEGSRDEQGGEEVDSPDTERGDSLQEKPSDMDVASDNAPSGYDAAGTDAASANSEEKDLVNGGEDSASTEPNAWATEGGAEPAGDVNGGEAEQHVRVREPDGTTLDSIGEGSCDARDWSSRFPHSDEAAGDGTGGAGGGEVSAGRRSLLPGGVFDTAAAEEEREERGEKQDKELEKKEGERDTEGENQEDANTLGSRASGSREDSQDAATLEGVVEPAEFEEDSITQGEDPFLDTGKNLGRREEGKEEGSLPGFGTDGSPALGESTREMLEPNESTTQDSSCSEAISREIGRESTEEIASLFAGESLGSMGQNAAPADESVGEVEEMSTVTQWDSASGSGPTGEGSSSPPLSLGKEDRTGEEEGETHAQQREDEETREVHSQQEEEKRSRTGEEDGEADSQHGQEKEGEETREAHSQHKEEEEQGSRTGEEYSQHGQQREEEEMTEAHSQHKEEEERGSRTGEEGGEAYSQQEEESRKETEGSSDEVLTAGVVRGREDEGGDGRRNEHREEDERRASSTRDRSRSRDRRRSRSRDRRSRSRDRRSRSRDRRSRSRSRDRQRERDREKRRERDRYHRDRERDRHYDRERDHHRDRRDRSRDRERDRRNRSRERDRDRDRDRDYYRHRDDRRYR